MEGHGINWPYQNHIQIIFTHYLEGQRGKGNSEGKLELYKQLMMALFVIFHTKKLSTKKTMVRCLGVLSTIWLFLFEVRLTITMTI